MRVYFHIVGWADIGHEKGAPKQDAIDRFLEDPLFTVRRQELDNEVRTTPFVTLLEDPKFIDIDLLVLIATQQEPQENGDTAGLAEVLGNTESKTDKSPIETIWNFYNRKPPPVEVLTLRELSIVSVIRDLQSFLSKFPGTEIDAVLEIGTGAKALFNGVLFGLLSKEIIPEIIILNSGVAESANVQTFIKNTVDIRKWLGRYRYWDALAELVDQELKRTLLKTSDIEHQRIGKGLQFHTTAYLWSSIEGDLARGNPVWLAKVVRLIEESSRRMVMNIHPVQENEIKAYLNKALTSTTSLTLGVNNPLEDRLSEVAKLGGDPWLNCPHVPKQLSDFWEGSSETEAIGARYLRAKVTRFNHRPGETIRDQESIRIRAKQTHELVKTLPSGWNVDAVSTQISMAGYSPKRFGDSVCLMVRNIGQSETPNMGAVLADYSTTAVRSEQLELVIENFLNLESCHTEILRKISERVREIEKSGQQVSEIVLFVGQGTKQMNVALLSAGIVCAFHEGVPLHLAEISKIPSTNESRLDLVDKLDAASLVRQLLPIEAKKKILGTALQSLDLDLLFNIRELLSAHDLQVRESIIAICSVFENDKKPKETKEDRIARAMVSCKLLMNQKQCLGDAALIIRISQILSHLSPGTDDPWKKNLSNLWSARNRALHPRHNDTGVELPSWPGDTIDAIIKVSSEITGVDKTVVIEKYNLQLNVVDTALIKVRDWIQVEYGEGLPSVGGNE